MYGEILKLEDMKKELEMRLLDEKNDFDQI